MLYDLRFILASEFGNIAALIECKYSSGLGQLIVLRMAAHPIGIDLGTSYSVVAVLYEDKVHVIQNTHSSRISPSCVAFTEDTCLIGEDALTSIETITEENLVFDVKRMIGRQFDDNILQTDRTEWPFKVGNEAGRPVIQVTYKGESMNWHPEQISAMILVQMKEQAEQFLHQKVTKAVITVPAHFNDAQRKATEDAAKIAGLDVLRLLNEPTAAALAYGLHKKSENEKVLVYDLGGGTFDVSVLKLDKELFQVLSTAGDSHLGGNDFNKRLADYLIKVFKDQYRKDISKNKLARHRLVKVSETIKKFLTTTDKCSYKINSLCEGIDFDINISREKFNELNDDLFVKTIEHVKLALADANLKKSDIDNVILIGGSTRIPKIRSILQDFFEDKQLHLSINPDESVAYGAAIQASIMAGPKSSVTDNVLLLDVTPLSLGTAVRSEIMCVIIPRNTQIPAKQCKRFTTVVDDQTSVAIHVYEGEREFVKDNNLLGKFVLSGIPPAPAGEQSIDMTFDINADGVLDVIAELCGTDNEGYLTIDRSKVTLSDEKIEEMVKEAQQFKIRDRQDRESFAAKSGLIRLTEKISSNLNSFSSNSPEKESLTKKLDEIKTWMEHKHSKEEYTQMKQNLEKIWKPFRVKLMTADLQRPKTKPETEKKKTHQQRKKIVD